MVVAVKRRPKPGRPDPMPAYEPALNPCLEAWLELTPAERLRRSWRMRRRLPDPAAAHDAKYLPEL